MCALQNMSDEMEREKARQRTYEALTAKLIDDCTRIQTDNGAEFHLFNEKLREWENYDNYQRPSGA